MYPYINAWLEPLITFIYPAKCRRCEQPMRVSRFHYICDECWEQIEYLTPPWCETCGMPHQLPDDSVATSVSDTLSCADCQARPPLYDRLRAIAFYEPTLREVIRLFKYHKKLGFAKQLGQLIEARFPTDLSADAYDFLLPVPLHRKRQRDRGFNQAEQIAKGIAKFLKVPVRTDILRRVRNTIPQSRLNSPRERIDNIKDAFDLRSPEAVRDCAFLLVDDIFTTGTTVNEIVKVLKIAGATRVDVLVLARVRLPAHSARASL